MGRRPEGTGFDLFWFDLSQVSCGSSSLNRDQMILESIRLELIYQLSSGFGSLTLNGRPDDSGIDSFWIGLSTLSRRPDDSGFGLIGIEH